MSCLLIEVTITEFLVQAGLGRTQVHCRNLRRIGVAPWKIATLLLLIFVAITIIVIIIIIIIIIIIVIIIMK